MVRPQKTGIEYFPFDVGLLRDNKLRRPKMKYGYLASAVYLALLSLLYADKGYYIPYGTEKEKDDCIWYVFECLQGKYIPKLDTIADVIDELVASGLFSDDRYPSYITSKRAQAVYYSATVERKSVVINDAIWLLSLDEMRILSERHSYYLSKVSRPKNDDIRPNNADNRPIDNESKANNTNIDVYSKDKYTYLTRTREEWIEVIDIKCGLESSEAACIASLGDDELYNFVLNIILDVLIGGKDVKVGDKLYDYVDIAQAVENMQRNVFIEIVGAFCKVDNEMHTIEKKQISNPTNYIVTLLMIKSNK